MAPVKGKAVRKYGRVLQRPPFPLVPACLPPLAGSAISFPGLPLTQKHCQLELEPILPLHAPCCWPGHVLQPSRAQDPLGLHVEATWVPTPPPDQANTWGLEGQRRPHQGLPMRFTCCCSWGRLPSKETFIIRTWGHLHVRKSKWVERSRGLAMSPRSKETRNGPWRWAVL